MTPRFHELEDHLRSFARYQRTRAGEIAEHVVCDLRAVYPIDDDTTHRDQVAYVRRIIDTIHLAWTEGRPLSQEDLTLFHAMGSRRAEQGVTLAQLRQGMAAARRVGWIYTLDYINRWPSRLTIVGALAEDIVGTVRQSSGAIEAGHSEGARLLSLSELDHDPISRPGPEDTGLVTPLTAREEWVLGRMMDGLSTDEIAEAGACAIETVRVHVKSIYRKLGVHSRGGAMAWVHRTGWRSSMEVPR